MTPETAAALKRRVLGYRRRMYRPVYWAVAIGSAFQILPIIMAFHFSIGNGIGRIVQSALSMALVLFLVRTYARKLASLLAARNMAMYIYGDASRNEDGSPLASSGMDKLEIALTMIKVGEIMYGPDGPSKEQDGVDPMQSHPDDRRQRLAELLTIAAWAPLPPSAWRMRIDLIAVAQLCIAAEVLQSRSVSGRIRNLWLRMTAKRQQSEDAFLLVPVEASA